MLSIIIMIIIIMIIMIIIIMIIIIMIISGVMVAKKDRKTTTAEPAGESRTPIVGLY